MKLHHMGGAPMTHAEEVDAAIERASRGPRVASDPYWAEVDADDRLLAEEVVRLRQVVEDMVDGHQREIDGYEQEIELLRLGFGS